MEFDRNWMENSYVDNNYDDTHPGWVIVRDGMYYVADKIWSVVNELLFKQPTDRLKRVTLL